jgi:hypothetical protein
VSISGFREKRKNLLLVLSVEVHTGIMKGLKMRINKSIIFILIIIIILFTIVGILFNIIHKQNIEIKELKSDNIEIKEKLEKFESNINDIDYNLDNSKFSIWKEIRELIYTANSLGYDLDYLIKEHIESRN